MMNLLELSKATGLPPEDLRGILHDRYHRVVLHELAPVNTEAETELLAEYAIRSPPHPDSQYPHQTGRELYCKQDGQPILLLCNGTPDAPDTTAVVYCTTGRALDWSPRLSAGTGSPEPVEGVDDFSQHPTPGAAP